MKITIQPPGNVITCNFCHIRSEWGKDIDITEVIKNINEFEQQHDNCDEVFESKINIEVIEAERIADAGQTFTITVSSFKLELLRQQMKRSGKSAEALILEGLYKIL